MRKAVKNRLLANFLCTPVISGPPCQALAHQYFEERPARSAWCFTFYEDFALALRKLEQGKSKKQVSDELWRMMCAEQDATGPRAYKVMHLCQDCALEIMASHIDLNMVIVAMVPAMIMGRALLFITDRRTATPGVLSGFSTRNPSQQELRAACRAKNTVVFPMNEKAS